jgi:hypothetical protein
VSVEGEAGEAQQQTDRELVELNLFFLALHRQAAAAAGLIPGRWRRPVDLVVGQQTVLLGLQRAARVTHHQHHHLKEMLAGMVLHIPVVAAAAAVLEQSV